MACSRSSAGVPHILAGRAVGGATCGGGAAPHACGSSAGSLCAPIPAGTLHTRRGRHRPAAAAAAASAGSAGSAPSGPRPPTGTRPVCVRNGGRWWPCSSCSCPCESPARPSSCGTRGAAAAARRTTAGWLGACVSSSWPQEPAGRACGGEFNPGMFTENDSLVCTPRCTRSSGSTVRRSACRSADTHVVTTSPEEAPPPPSALPSPWQPAWPAGGRAPPNTARTRT
eukprot:333374-Chlamydomonas_euryale.AAC.1